MSASTRAMRAIAALALCALVVGLSPARPRAARRAAAGALRMQLTFGDAIGVVVPSVLVTAAPGYYWARAKLTELEQDHHRQITRTRMAAARELDRLAQGMQAELDALAGAQESTAARLVATSGDLQARSSRLESALQERDRVLAANLHSDYPYGHATPFHGGSAQERAPQVGVPVGDPFEGFHRLHGWRLAPIFVRAR